MIKVFGRHLCVPENEKTLGFVHDNLVETRIFKITDPNLFQFAFKLELEIGSMKNIMDLPGKMEEDALFLTWTVPASCLQLAGPLYAQIRAFNDSDIVWHSEIASFHVNHSISAEATLPPVVPTEFSEMEKRMTEIAKSAEDLALRTEKAALDAASYNEGYSESLSRAEECASAATNALKEVQYIAATINETHNRILQYEQSAQNAKTYVESQTQIAYESASEAKENASSILTSLGDLHAVLDAILSLENTFTGGDTQ